MDGGSLLGHTRLLSDLVDALRAEGIANLSLNYFSARQQQSITKFAAARGIPAIQLEINATWLNPSHSDLAAHRFSQLLQALVRYIEHSEPGSLRKTAIGKQTDLAELQCASHLPPG